MFTYIKAKNFKSLKDIELNLNKTNDKTNKFIAIYGENGSGKTNIVELFELLQRLVAAMSADTAIRRMHKDIIEMQKKMMPKLPKEFEQILKLYVYLEEYRMIDEKEPTEIEYGFKINNIDGFYYIKFDNEIIEEKLYYMAGKQRAYLFQISREGNKIVKNLNNNIFKDRKYNEELIEIIDKYWGKYSFLSLLSLEMLEKNKEYVNSKISKNIFDVIDQILLMTVHVDDPITGMISKDTTRDRKLSSIKSGMVEKGKLNEIKKYENVLNIFFTQAYSDIKEVK